jgi:hypothetical protein
MISTQATYNISTHTLMTVVTTLAQLDALDV